MADRYQYPDCFGPYLRYAIDSGFDNFRTDLEKFGQRFLSFDEKQFRLVSRGFHWVNEFPFNR